MGIRVEPQQVIVQAGRFWIHPLQALALPARGRGRLSLVVEPAEIVVLWLADLAILPRCPVRWLGPGSVKFRRFAGSPIETPAPAKTISSRSRKAFNSGLGKINARYDHGRLTIRPTSALVIGRRAGRLGRPHRSRRGWPIVIRPYCWRGHDTWDGRWSALEGGAVRGAD